jgi:hypothetical protein
MQRTKNKATDSKEEVMVVDMRGEVVVVEEEDMVDMDNGMMHQGVEAADTEEAGGREDISNILSGLETECNSLMPTEQHTPQIAGHEGEGGGGKSSIRRVGYSRMWNEDMAVECY